MANGGLATTRNGRRGNRRSAASAMTTVTWSSREPPPQLGGAPRVELDRDDMSATGDEGFGERASARPDVEHEIVRADPSIHDKYCSPSTTELMPPPPCPSRGHDAPS